jgi:hypothetical protein
MEARWLTEYGGDCKDLEGAAATRAGVHKRAMNAR